MLLLLLVSFLVGSEALRLTPGAFLKLNNSYIDDLSGIPTFGNEAATSAAYDPTTKFLYVIGTGGDVLNIVSVVDPNNPVKIRKVTFDDQTEGYPAAIAFCRYGMRHYLAIGFQTMGTSSRAYVKIYHPLDTPDGDMDVINKHAQLDGYDPTAMEWTKDCSELVVVQQGRVHKIGHKFDDPKPFIDILIPGNFGVVTRKQVPIDVPLNNYGHIETYLPEGQNQLREKGVRHVLEQCEDNPEQTSTAYQDLEPRSLAIDPETNEAVVTFPKNNAIGFFNVKPPGGTYSVDFKVLGSKSWKASGIDTVDDKAIRLVQSPISTFYQSADVALFKHNGVTYMATADTGEITSLSGPEDGCEFEDSSPGIEWIKNEEFSAAISANDKEILKKYMNDTKLLGQMRFSKQRHNSDYFNYLDRGFNQVTGFGGRGMSILKSGTDDRVWQSGDLFEQAFVNSKYEDVFNADVGSASSTPSSRKDKTSPTTGPSPGVVVAGEIGDTQVLVVANGKVGGIHYFTVDKSGGEPIPVHQGFYRRGNVGLDWETSYQMDNDHVGEPDIRDIQWIDLGSKTEAMIAVLSNRAGVVSFYRLTL